MFNVAFTFSAVITGRLNSNSVTPVKYANNAILKVQVDGYDLISNR
jgi:hypothetical protein